MVKILDGRIIQAKIQKGLARRAKRFASSPRLVVIQVGDRPESNLYIAKKKTFGEKIGAKVTHLKYAETISETKLIKAITNFNLDPSVHGIIIQMPLPTRLQPISIMNAVSSLKDVDGLNSISNFCTATTRGVLTLLKHYGLRLSGQRVVVVGRSLLVGKPIALACLKASATVTICHRQTENLTEVTKQGDILIVAVGVPNLITADYVRAGQIVIDVGINVVSGQKLLEEINNQRQIVGDVAFEEVKSIVHAISPVPGGVGPLTIGCLFENLFEAYHQQIKKLPRKE